MKLQLQEHHFVDIPEIQEELLLYALFQTVSFTGASAVTVTVDLPRKLRRGPL